MLSWLGKLLHGAPTRVPARDEAAALLRDALAHQQAGRYGDAERCLYRALALAPEAAELHLQLGDLFRATGRHEAALQCCLEAARIAPAFAQGRNNLGNAYRDLGRLDEALAEYRRALELDSGVPEAHFNLANLLWRRGEATQAAASYRAALRLKPDFALAGLNLGYVLEEDQDLEGAIASYSAAVAADPRLVEAHVNLGMQLLLAGRFAEGWEEYEWRLRYPEYRSAAAGASRWDGAPRKEGTILLESEQGLGDAIQFLRYAPMVAARAARVVVRCSPRQTALFGRTPGIAAVVASDAPLPAFDAYCPLPSLPRLFGTTLESIPAQVPYIFADPEKAARWKARLAESASECRVGLAWASQSKQRAAGAKSIPLEGLAPLAQVPGVRFYSLQIGEAARQAERPPAGMRIVDLKDEQADFSDTAAIAANLDLVISVDTSVAHLAGAMGLPAWTFVKFAPDWRWLLGRDDSPWYPTMRLFRQRRRDDWSAPIASAAQALRQFAAAREASGRSSGGT